MIKKTFETLPIVFIAVLLAGASAANLVEAQSPRFVPVTPKPGSGPGGWQPAIPNAPAYRTAALNTAPMQTGPIQNSHPAPQAPFDGFAVHSSSAPGITSNGYSQPPMQLAQVPIQYQQPGLPVQPPGYVPRNYLTPAPQNYPGWNAANSYPYGSQGGYQPLWTAQINGLYMTRTNAPVFPLLVSGGGATLVNAQQLDFGWKTGFDVALSRRYGNYRNFELRFFQIDGWTARFSAPFAVGDAIATNPPSPLFAAGTFGNVYRSSIHSFEMNLVSRVAAGGGFRLAMGFRWIELSENLAQTFAPTTTALEIDTNNHLYGLQLGADGVLFQSRTGRLNVASWIKGGIYANVADQTTTLTSPAIFGGARRTRPSFVGETGLIADFAILPRVSLIGGYQFMWVSGAALAADQMPNISSVATGLVPTRLDRSDVFYHGAIFGIDIHW